MYLFWTELEMLARITEAVKDCNPVLILLHLTCFPSILSTCAFGCKPRHELYTYAYHQSDENIENIWVDFCALFSDEISLLSDIKYS